MWVRQYTVLECLKEANLPHFQVWLLDFKELLKCVKQPGPLALLGPH